MASAGGRAHAGARRLAPSAASHALHRRRRARRRRAPRARARVLHAHVSRAGTRRDLCAPAGGRVAGERGATSVVMTFDPHPPRVVRPDKAPPLLMTHAQKLEALARAGLQGAAIVPFTVELSRWDPEMFVRAVLVDWLHVAEVWVGANFLFGHDRAGNFSLLRALGIRYGFKAEK